MTEHDTQMYINKLKEKIQVGDVKRVVEHLSAKPTRDLVRVHTAVLGQAPESESPIFICDKIIEALQ